MNATEKHKSGPASPASATNGTARAAGNTPFGLQTVAGFEFAKGILFLLFAFGALTMEQKEIASAANTLILRLHIDPTWHYAQKLVDALTPQHIRTFGFAALGIACLRMLEGWYLWHGKAWAEWLAVISSAIYIPFEVHHFLTHANGKSNYGVAIVLVVNLAIVIYLAVLLYENHKRKHPR